MTAGDGICRGGGHKGYVGEGRDDYDGTGTGIGIYVGKGSGGYDAIGHGCYGSGGYDPSYVYDDGMHGIGGHGSYGNATGEVVLVN